MLNEINYHFSLIIILNNRYFSLRKFLQNLIINGDKKYQVVIIDTLEKPFILSEEDKNNSNITIIRGTSFSDNYKKLETICQGEILVFTANNCRRDSQWLENILEPFKDIRVNITAGDVVSKDNFFTKITNLFKKKNRLNSTLNIYQDQLYNLAIRRSFFQQQKPFDISSAKQEESHYYYRLLRELEAEITYVSSATIYK